MTRGNDDREPFILSHLKQHPITEVRYRPGAPEAPRPGTGAFLVHLNEWAEVITLRHPEAPRILRQGDSFVLDRPERKRIRYRSIYTVLKKLLFELSAKDA